MKLAPFFANRRCQVAPPLRDEGAAFWWSKMKKISLGNVHKWTKTSRCVILNEIKVKTLGNQRFVFLENFQRSERKQTLPLPSWMFFSFIFPPFFVCFYFGHKSGLPTWRSSSDVMFFLLQRHSDGRNWVEWAAGGRPFQAQKEVEMSKQKITAQIIIQTKFVRYEFGGGGDEETPLLKKKTFLKNRPGRREKLKAEMPRHFCCWCCSALLAKKFSRNFALCDSLYVTPTSSLFTIGAAASFDQTWQLPTGSCLHFIGNNQTKLALSCKKWE